MHNFCIADGWALGRWLDEEVEMEMRGEGTWYRMRKGACAQADHRLLSLVWHGLTVSTLTQSILALFVPLGLVPDGWFYAGDQVTRGKLDVISLSLS